MSAIFASNFTLVTLNSPKPSSKFSTFSTKHPLISTKLPSCPNPLNSLSITRKIVTLTYAKPSEEEEEEAEIKGSEDEWLQRLPDKEKPLYSHSLPCIEAWLKSLGFYQSKDDRAVWFVDNPKWHAQLSLDMTDLYIRYLKSGPANLEKVMERRFSYALSREDIENAILGGP